MNIRSVDYVSHNLFSSPRSLGSKLEAQLRLDLPFLFLLLIYCTAAEKVILKISKTGLYGKPQCFSASVEDLQKNENKTTFSFL